MQTRMGIGVGPIIASIFAGPIFATLFAVIQLYMTLPGPIVIELREIGLFAMLMFGVAILGFAVAIVPNIIASFIMASLGRGSDFLRLPIFWILAGFALPVFGALALSIKNPEILTLNKIAPVLAFPLTGAICGAICRRTAYWYDEPTQHVSAMTQPAPAVSAARITGPNHD